ncbi:MAG: hypothetical protein AMXMBFR7_31900 [Planctomycetota bacterium]
MSAHAPAWPSRLVVGGHSFIPELGNDPAVSFETQLALVSACLDSGINGFDTTYEAERVALGRVLDELGRRSEARLLAWNFFADPSSGAYLVGPTPYGEPHLDRMLQQLRTDRIDLLVVHPAGSAEEHAKQVEVARRWRDAGRVGALGTWAPSEALLNRSPDPYAFFVHPRNPAQPSDQFFSTGAAHGWRGFATSPFNRGWLLDTLVMAAHADEGVQPEEARTWLSDALLRFALFAPGVDHVIVGIRKLEWIERNRASLASGPLAENESARLMRLFERTRESHGRS